ncbi:MAG: FAD-dependent oxidoreductase [Zavarzinella sp.]
MDKISDVLIVGGGVIGLTCAYHLASKGLTVTLVDRRSPGKEASWAGAGIVPPGNPQFASTGYEQLRALSTSRFAEFCAQLQERTNLSSGFRKCGGLVLLHHDEIAETMSHWVAEGIECQEISDPDIQSCEPGLRIPQHHVAVALPTLSQVRNPWHLKALEEGCRRQGVIILPENEIVGWHGKKQHLCAAIDERGTHLTAKNFVLCAGAWSNRLLPPGVPAMSLYPVKGQLVQFKAEPNTLKHVIELDRSYLVPRGDGLILAGSTEEPEAEYDKLPTEHGTEVLKEFACAVVPALQHYPVVRTWAGLRPGTADGLPYIGKSNAWDNLILATGHFRAGIQLSIATAEVVEDLIIGTTPRLEVDMFRLDRPAAPRYLPAFRS